MEYFEVCTRAWMCVKASRENALQFITAVWTVPRTEPSSHDSREKATIYIVVRVVASEPLRHFGRKKQEC